mmetsp:Transcript_5085/g.10381  ORF Transcript_5085/g.10381 Transcript_5085/m.10381 type:complete len:111 (+) Transcript_5085:4782-5114(+)
MLGLPLLLLIMLEDRPIPTISSSSSMENSMASGIQLFPLLLLLPPAAEASFLKRPGTMIKFLYGCIICVNSKLGEDLACDNNGLQFWMWQMQRDDLETRHAYGADTAWDT